MSLDASIGKSPGGNPNGRTSDAEEFALFKGTLARQMLANVKMAVQMLCMLGCYKFEYVGCMVCGETS